MYFVASDIHLEYYTVGSDNLNELKSRICTEIASVPLADRVLFLCGDIGSPLLPTYADFLGFCSTHFSVVYLITGNHEYYNPPNSTEPYDMQQIRSIIVEQATVYPNVRYLDNSYTIDDAHSIIVYGSTLWSKQRPYNTYKGINDFTYIVTPESKKTNSNITLEQYDELHEQAIRDLQSAMRDIRAIRTDSKYGVYDLIIMTHHLPSRDLIAPQFIDNDNLNQFFATDLEYIFEQNQNNNCVAYCFAGHTHYRMQIAKSGIRFVVHPYGYPGQIQYDETDSVLYRCG